MLKKVQSKRFVTGLGEKSVAQLIGKKESWRNAERAFESSALMAIGECS